MGQDWHILWIYLGQTSWIMFPVLTGWTKRWRYGTVLKLNLLWFAYNHAPHSNSLVCHRPYTCTCYDVHTTKLSSDAFLLTSLTHNCTQLDLKKKPDLTLRLLCVKWVNNKIIIWCQRYGEYNKRWDWWIKQPPGHKSHFNTNELKVTSKPNKERTNSKGNSPASCLLTCIVFIQQNVFDCTCVSNTIIRWGFCISRQTFFSCEK